MTAPVTKRYPRHHIRHQLLGFSLFAPATVFLTGGHLYSIAMTAVAYGMLAYALFKPACPWLAPVVTRFRTDKKEVWLTIDDGPDGDNTRKLLEILARHKAKATFFLKGESVEKQAAVTAEILVAGHSIGNHTQTHPAYSFWCHPPRWLRREIVACNRAIEQATGKAPALFRAPVGIKSLFLYPILAGNQLRLVGWSLKGKDGIVCDPEIVVARVKEAVQPGDIILLHEGKFDSARQPSSNACLDRVVAELTAMGYSFVIPAEEQFC